jgi:ABC-type transport system substrate-binding protein
MSALAESVKVGVAQRDLGVMDPAFGIGNGDEFPIRQVFNVLVGPKNGSTELRFDHLQGELAETWEMAPDARSFTFHLRHGVQWHHVYGEVTTEDIAFTIQRMKYPKTGSAYGSNFSDIKSVDVIDKYTVTIHIANSNPFYHALALAPRFGGYINRKGRSRSSAKSSATTRWAAAPSSGRRTSQSRRSSCGRTTSIGTADQKLLRSKYSTFPKPRPARSRSLRVMSI